MTDDNQNNEVAPDQKGRERKYICIIFSAHANGYRYSEYDHVTDVHFDKKRTIHEFLNEQDAMQFLEDLAGQCDESTNYETLWHGWVVAESVHHAPKEENEPAEPEEHENLDDCPGLMLESDHPETHTEYHCDGCEAQCHTTTPDVTICKEDTADMPVWKLYFHRAKNPKDTEFETFMLENKCITCELPEDTDLIKFKDMLKKDQCKECMESVKQEGQQALAESQKDL